MHRVKTVSVFTAVVCVIVGVGCDFNPTAPFAGFDGEGGATLRGQFQQSGTATALRTMGSTGMSQLAQVSASSIEAVKVIVLDFDNNEIGSVDIKDGAFTLRGLPEDFKLQFLDASDNPLGDPMEFRAVKPNQEIDIVVAMDNGSVVILEERRTGIDHEGASGIELEGVARNIVIDSATDPMTGSLDVYAPDRYHVLTRAAETSIRKGNRSLTLDDLDDGDRVHVRGVWDGDDVFAYEIKLQEEEEDDTAPDTCDVRDPEKPNHILICHKGRTISVSPDAWAGHRSHGDTCGPCN
jgi:hypothetical protein